MNARMTFGCHWFQSIQFLTGTKVGDNVKYSFDDQCKSVNFFYKVRHNGNEFTYKAAVSDSNKSVWFLIGSLITGSIKNSYHLNLCSYDELIFFVFA